MSALRAAAVGACLSKEKCARCGKRVPKVAWWGNLTLTVYKLVVGILGGSSALVADAFHSLTDVVGTTVIMVSCRIAERPADEDHPYGHGKAEFMSSAFIYVVLMVLSIGFFVGGLLIIIHMAMHPPMIVTLLAGVVSTIYNVLMYRYGQCAGKRNRSPALLANSFENRADAISSAAVVVGIALAIFVHPICDPLAAMAVGVIIFVNCMVELRKALHGLLDRSLPPAVIDDIRATALSFPEVAAVYAVKTRPMGISYWLDLEIAVEPGMAVDQAEQVAGRLSAELLRRSDKFQQVEIYLRPDGNEASPVTGAAMSHRPQEGA